MPEGGGGPIESTMARAGQAGPIGAEPPFGLPGMSIEAPGSYFGGRPVGGPSSIFNIGGAPIAVLGGVFSGGLPLGGPVGQIFRSSAPVPNTLFISTLEPSGPIGQDAIGSGSQPLGGPGSLSEPIGGFLEAAGPIGGEALLAGASLLGEPTTGLGGLTLGGLTLGGLTLGGLTLGGLSGLNSLNGTMQRD